MAFKQFILPALALAGHALAQRCPDGDSFEISSSSDASQLANCSEFEGDIIITEEASGNIQLNGIRAIGGDLRCINATQLTSLSADQLGSIGGIFDLERLTILADLTMGSLSRVNTIKFISLPALGSLNFATGISRANNVEISDTRLTDLSGIELEAVTEMNINNNIYLKEVDVNALTNVTRGLTFAANHEELTISLPNLESAANLTFINTSDVSMPSLAQVGGSMGFYFGTFQSFAAPNLTRTGNDIAFVSCGSLNNLSCPSLESIGGGFLIANNTDLETIDDFNKLETIGGALDFRGVFNNVSFNALSDVRGGANVESSTTNEALCDAFTRAASRGIIKGDTECRTEVENDQTNGSSTTSGGGSSSSSSGAANPGIFDPSAPLTGLSALIAAILFI